jgi:hypothetical protein
VILKARSQTEPGDFVFRRSFYRDPAVGNKLRLRFDGPFEVLKVYTGSASLTPTNYKLEHVRSKHQLWSHIQYLTAASPLPTAPIPAVSRPDSAANVPPPRAAPPPPQLVKDATAGSTVAVRGPDGSWFLAEVLVVGVDGSVTGHVLRPKRPHSDDLSQWRSRRCFVDPTSDAPAVPLTNRERERNNSGKPREDHLQRLYRDFALQDIAVPNITRRPNGLFTEDALRRLRSAGLSAPNMHAFDGRTGRRAKLVAQERIAQLRRPTSAAITTLFRRC